MLSRDAQGLYWMSRYLERAAHLCRLLADQLESIEDRPVDEIDRGWRRLYAALGRRPAGGDLESNLGREQLMLADAYTLTDDLAFEEANPDSVASCIAAARENARQVRSTISGDMWSCLNVAYLGLRDMRLADVWNDQPRSFFIDTCSAARTFSGIAENDMYRDHGWSFLRLGRFVERALLVTALVDAHVALFPADEADTESDWGSLLAVCEARAAYHRLRSRDYRPADVLDFLVADEGLSHSVRHALRRISDELRVVAGRRDRAPAAVRRVGRVAARLDYDWPLRDPRDDAETRRTLAEIRDACRLLHGDIETAYFDYAIEDAPDP